MVTVGKQKAEMKYSSYLQTEYWKQVSAAVKTRAKYKCQLCNSPHDLNAHHRTYEVLGREMEHLDELVCLCHRCHSLFHGKVQIPEVQPEPKPEPAYNHEADMPKGVIGFILTPALIDKTKTRNGGWTAQTLEALGLGRQPSKGWYKRLVGVLVSRERYLEALKGREVKSGSKKR